MKKGWRLALTWLTTFACLGILAGLQAAEDTSAKSIGLAEKQAALGLSEPLIPSVTTLKALSLGQNQIAADMLWLSTIQYFGGGTAYINYPSLGPILNTITQIDPKFEEPYEFGMVVLPILAGQNNYAITLGQRAQTTQPGNGLLDYYLASDYMINLKDYPDAAKYYQKAAKEPGSPSAAISLAGIALNHADSSTDDLIIAIDYWKTVAANAKSSDTRQEATNWAQNMEMVYQLEQAAQQYKNINGHFPATLQDLVTAGLISQIPVSPLNRVFTLNPKTGEVTYDTLAS